MYCSHVVCVCVCTCRPLDIMKKKRSAGFDIEDVSVDSSIFYVACWMHRADRVNMYFEHLRAHHYKETGFKVGMLKWENTAYAVVEVPLADKKILEAAALECGMQLDDGTPVFIGRGEKEAVYFPLQGDNVWTLVDSPQNEDIPILHANGGTTTATTKTNKKGANKKGVRNCHNCFKGSDDDIILKRCSVCRMVFYCSDKCQCDDWNNHRKLCYRMRDLQEKK